MRVIEGKTEEEILEVVDRVVARLAPSFVFGCYELDDLKQEGRIFAIKLIDSGKYDPSRPLENFLFTHVKRRFLNFIRDNKTRSDAPCKECHGGIPCTGTKYFCDIYQKWFSNNKKKSNVYQPASLHAFDISDLCHNSMCVYNDYNDVEIGELLIKLRNGLPLDMQESFLQMQSGIPISNAKKDRLIELIKKILRDDIEDN